MLIRFSVTFCDCEAVLVRHSLPVLYNMLHSACTVCRVILAVEFVVKSQEPRWRQRTKFTTEVNKKHDFLHKSESILTERSAICRNYFPSVTEPS